MSIMDMIMGIEAIQSEWVGRVIDGRFTLLKWLGGRGRSGVFLTELPGPQAKKAAIKLIVADGVDAEALMAGWAATKPLSHPNLMRLYHTGRCETDEGEVLFSVGEYSDEVLSDILPERPLTPAEAREMLEPVIDVLSYLHGKGLVHGNLKPSNVMVVDDRLKISGDSLRMVGQMGNGDASQGIYEAPEMGSDPILPGVDVWGLGATLVETLTQRPPEWDRLTQEDPVVPESMPQPFAGIARGSLRADPVGRCTLDNVKTWLGVQQPVAEAAGKTDAKRPASDWRPIFAAAAILVLALIGIFMVRSRQGQATPAAASVPVEVQQPATEATPTPQTAQEQPAPAADVSSQAQAQETTPVTAPAEVAENKQASSVAPQPLAPATVSQESKPAVAPVTAPAAPVLKTQPSSGAIAEQVQPDVLPKALESIHGKFKVRVRVAVDAAGNVSNASFDSEGPSKYFANAALKAAQQFKFKPAAPGAWILQFQFTRDGAEVISEAAQ